VRNARAEYNVEVGKKIGATLVVGDAEERQSLASELQVRYWLWLWVWVWVWAAV
jgi:hypothetical protein